MEINTLSAISPIDGRYRKSLENLADYFSEFALIKYRVKVEILWLIELNSVLDFSLSIEDLNTLNTIVNDFSLEDSKRIKTIEDTTKHDVKAVEYFIREKLEKTSLEKLSCFVHFACTSEDISNLAYGLMIKNAISQVWLPNAEKLITSVKQKAQEEKMVPMLAHTHGQPASPTTVGKELLVFVNRWNSILAILKKIELFGKFGGAVRKFSCAYCSISIFRLASYFPQICRKIRANL